MVICSLDTLKKSKKKEKRIKKEVLDCYNNLVTVRSSRPEVVCKKVFLEISQNSQENSCARVSFL